MLSASDESSAKMIPENGLEMKEETIIIPVKAAETETVFQKRSKSGYIWFSFNCLFYIGCFIHTGFLVARYQTFPTNTEIRVMRTAFVFPDVTICPSQPFDRTKSRKKGFRISHDIVTNLSFYEVFDKVKYAWEKVVFPAIVQSNYSKTNPVIFHQFLDLDNDFTDYAMKSLMSIAFYNDIYDEPHDQIIFCRYKGEPCWYANFTLFYHYTQYMCMTFRPSERNFSTPGEDFGLDLILYTGDRENRLSKLKQISGKRGYEISLHRPNTYPDFQKRHFNAQPGTLVNVGVEMFAKYSVNNENSPCQEAINSYHIEDNFASYAYHDELEEVAKQVFNYSTAGCNAHRYNYLAQTNCKCSITPASGYGEKQLCLYMDPQFYLPNYNNTSGDAFNETLEDLVKRAYCYTDYITTYSGHIIKTPDTKEPEHLRCSVIPCNSSVYKLTYMTDVWPHNPSKAYAYMKMVINNALKYINLVGLDNQTIAKVQEIYHHKTNFTRKSFDRDFVSIKIYPLTVDSELLDEQYSYPLTAFFSDLGGNLGLWVGICCVTISDFFKSLVAKFRKHKHNKRCSNPAQNLILKVLGQRK